MEMEEAVRRTVDGAETPTTVVVGAIADAHGVGTGEVAPLHDSVDPDALNSLFEPTTRRSRAGTVEFEHHGCRVELSCSDRATVEVAPLE